MVTDKSFNMKVNELVKRRPELEKVSESLLILYNILKTLFFNDKILFICGNGGSASDSEHIAGELLKGFKLKRSLSSSEISKFDDPIMASKLQKGLRAISLLSHPAFASAFINDVDPYMVYAQQLYVLGREGDAVIGISTSGNARNILNTFKVAKALNIKTILFTGENCGVCEKYADCVIKAPSSETYIIQEYHIAIYHALCLMLEEHFYGEK